jgi:hypothetical protein
VDAFIAKLGGDEVPGVGRFKGLNNLLVGCVRVAIKDVVFDTRVEKDWLLAHVAYLSTEFTQMQGVNGDAI